MTRTYYVGYPSLDHVPYRIGEPFTADTIAEARWKAVDVLRASPYEFGFLCIVYKDSVESRGTISARGFYSPCLVKDGFTVLAFGMKTFEDTWKPVKSPNP